MWFSGCLEGRLSALWQQKIFDELPVFFRRTDLMKTASPSAPWVGSGKAPCDSECPALRSLPLH